MGWVRDEALCVSVTRKNSGHSCRTLLFAFGEAILLYIHIQIYMMYMYLCMYIYIQISIRITSVC